MIYTTNGSQVATQVTYIYRKSNIFWKSEVALTCLLTGGAELKMTSFRSVMRSRSSGFGGPSISASSGLGVDFSAAAEEDGGLAVGGSNRSYFRTRLRDNQTYLNE